MTEQVSPQYRSAARAHERPSGTAVGIILFAAIMMIMDTITTKGEATTTMMIMGTITTTGRNLSLRCPTTRQPFLTASRPET